MKVNKIISEIRIKPTEKKIKKAEAMAKEISGLPKELPIEKEYRILSASEIFERVKDRIQNSINHMKNKG